MIWASLDLGTWGCFRISTYHSAASGATAELSNQTSEEAFSARDTAARPDNLELRLRWIEKLHSTYTRRSGPLGLLQRQAEQRLLLRGEQGAGGE